MKLEDVIPERPEFTLSSTGKTYVLRHPSIEDRVWLKRKFPNQAAMQAAFESRDWEVLSIIVMLLLVDRSDFAARDITEDVGVDGEPIKRRLSGPEAFRLAVTSFAEELAIIGALGAAFTGADPLIKQVVQDELKKKNLKTGEQSSTDLLTSTDGPSSTSEVEP
jgi:hypothetical protein